MNPSSQECRATGCMGTRIRHISCQQMSFDVRKLYTANDLSCAQSSNTISSPSGANQATIIQSAPRIRLIIRGL